MSTKGITTIEASSAADVVLSADQSKLYVALSSGVVDVFSLATQSKLASWTLGASPAAISLAQDGSYLLVNDSRQAVTYRVDTASGQVTNTYIGTGNPFTDVQVINGNRAVVTGTTPSILDLASGTFSPLSNATSYSGYSIMNSDGHLTLLGETGISSGPLFILDNSTASIIAHGDDYQSPNTGFNFGGQAASQAAGEVLQFAYYGAINIYDLTVKYQRSYQVGEPVEGMTFNPSGTHVYAYLSSGAVVEYDARTFAELARYAAAPTTVNSNSRNYGNTMLITDDEHYAVVTDGQSGSVQVIDLATAQHQLTGTMGSDVLTGTGADEVFTGKGAADTMTGGGGNDTFIESYSDLSGDRITDLAVGDRITVTDNVLSGLTYLRTGSALTVQYLPYSSANMDIGSANVRLVLAASDRGVDLVAANRMTGLADFNGDGHSDILWRNVNGGVSEWQLSGNVRGDQAQVNTTYATVDPSWKAIETFDWNGDGHSDILWRQAGGALSIWTGGADGNFQQSALLDRSVDNSWQIAGTGDLNGDGKDDLLWRNQDGSISTWNSSGADFQRNAYFHASVGTSWKVEGLADFNGDGRADIMWRNDNGALSTWLSTGSGFQESAYNSAVASSWHVVGLADFDGDGRADILWRNDNGALSIWRSNGSGFDQGVYNGSVSTDWHVATVGDFNDDGKADILWRNDNGALSTWQSNGSGFDQNIYNATVDTGWSIVGHSFPL